MWTAHDFYNVKGTDYGLHPHDAVNEVMLSIIADVLYPQMTE